MYVCMYVFFLFVINFFFSVFQVVVVVVVVYSSIPCWVFTDSHPMYIMPPLKSLVL